MAQWWEENLADATFAGITFPIETRAISGGRVVARRKTPFVDGARHEDQGREGMVWDLTIPLFRGIEEDLYPNRQRQLLAAFDSGEVAEYVDPEFGTFEAVKAVTWKWTAAGDKRDGGVLVVRLEESSTESAPFLRPSPTSPRLAAAVDTSTDAADAELAELGVSGDDVLGAMDEAGFPVDPEVLVEAGAVISAVVGAAAVVIRAATGSTDDIAALVDYTVGQLGAVLELDAVGGADGAAAFNALVDVIGAVRELGDAATARAASVVEYPVGTSAAGVSAFEIAATLYGTVERYTEVLDRSPTLCPLFYAAGSVLRLASR